MNREERQAERSRRLAAEQRLRSNKKRRAKLAGCTAFEERTGMSLQPNEPASNAGVTLGERLRDRGLSIAERRQRHLAGQRVTADDIHDELRLSDAIRHKWLGSVFRSLALAGVIRRSGAEPSKRPVCHARLQSIWCLADRSVAERWLVDHPEIPAPAMPSLLDGLDDRGAA